MVCEKPAWTLSQFTFLYTIIFVLVKKAYPVSIDNTADLFYLVARAV